MCEYKSHICGAPIYLGQTPGQFLFIGFTALIYLWNSSLNVFMKGFLRKGNLNPIELPKFIAIHEILYPKTEKKYTKMYH